MFTSTILEVYIHEVRFFERVAADAPVRVPECYHAAVDLETSRFVVVMEERARVGGWPSPGQQS